MLLKLSARSLALILALGGMAHADATQAPQTNDSSDSVDTRLSRLLGQEKTSVSAVAPTRIAEITTPPARAYDGATDKLQYTDAWLDSLPPASGDAQWSCLAKAIYFEARGEPVKGEFAVGEVVANRVDSPEFPQSYCSVVNETGHGGCAFSWVCDGLPDAIHERAAYEKAGKIARLILDGAPRALTDGATYFHAAWVHPAWGHGFQETAVIGGHLFYRTQVQIASN